MIPVAGPVEFSPVDIAVILLFLSIPAGLPGAIWGVITRRPRVLWFFLGYVIFLAPAVIVRGALVAVSAERDSQVLVFVEQLANTLYVLAPSVVAVVLIYRWYRRTQARPPVGSPSE